jgi:hypothetical protein
MPSNGLNYLINIENAVIIDVEPTPARTHDEVESTKTMLDRAERRFDLKPQRLAYWLSLSPRF